MIQVCEKEIKENKNKEDEESEGERQKIPLVKIHQ